MRVLIDSSVWIDFFHGRSVPHTRRLRQMLKPGEDLCICGHVLAEVLRGIRHDAQFRKVERRFDALEYLPIDERAFKTSASIYRDLRREGKTLKNSVDTFIAAVALRHSVPILHNDSDFDLIATAVPLRILR